MLSSEDVDCVVRVSGVRSGCVVCTEVVCGVGGCMCGEEACCVWVSVVWSGCGM